MRVLILGAGLGTRLRPLTDKIPKVMVKIGRKPLLYYHLELLKKHGFKDIWINIHWAQDLIKNYFGDGKKFGIKISYSFEEKLLGTAGALKNPKSGIEKEFKRDKFLVIYGDNLTNFDYSKLVKLHLEKKPIMTIGTYKTDAPWNKGLIEIDNQGKVLSFIEKPPKDKVTTNLTNGGIYLCEPAILNYIPSGFSDFGFDIFPKLIKENLSIFTLEPDYYFQDIGTFEALKKARKDLKMGKLRLN